LANARAQRQDDHTLGAAHLAVGALHLALIPVQNMVVSFCSIIAAEDLAVCLFFLWIGRRSPLPGQRRNLTLEKDFESQEGTRMFTTLRSRLIASYVLIVFLCLILAGLTTVILMRQYQERAAQRCHGPFPAVACHSR